jgi:hypothetical protein
MLLGEGACASKAAPEWDEVMSPSNSFSSSIKAQAP